TTQLLDENHNFGMAHTLADFDGDGNLDLFVVGMNSFVAQRLDHLQIQPPASRIPALAGMRSKMAYGNRLYLGTGRNFHQTLLSDRLARSGWSWGVTAGDFDNDGDLDLYIVNGHISAATAADYDTEFWRHDIYTGSSQEDSV